MKKFFETFNPLPIFIKSETDDPLLQKYNVTI